MRIGPILGLLIAAAPCRALAGASAADSLQQHIIDMQGRARYVEAARAAEQLVRLFAADSTSRPWELRGARQRAATLRSVLLLPERQRAELAAVDTLGPQLEGHFQNGEFAAAAAIARKQLEVRRRILSTQHLDVSISLTDLGYALTSDGRAAEAEQYFREALALDEQLYDPRDPNLAVSLNNVGMVLQEQGDYRGATPYIRRALALHEASLGRRDTLVVLDINNLATNLRYTGDLAGAETLLREALALRLELLPAGHPDLLVSYNNLASSLHAQGNDAEAESMYREALRLFEATLGDDHLDVVMARNNLAVLLSDQERYAEAERYLERQRAILERRQDPDHPDLARCMNNLAAARRGQGDLVAAERLSLEALDRARRRLGPSHPLVAISLDNLAGTFLEANRAGEAEKLLRESLAMRRRFHADAHPDVVHTLVLLGEALLCQGRTSAAESSCAQAAHLYEAARLRAGSDLARATFQESPYPRLAAARLLLGREAEAWTAAEAGLGRVLADLLIAADRRPLAADEKERERSLQSAVADLEHQLAAITRRSSVDSAGAERDRVAVRKSLARAEAALSSYRDALAKEHPVSTGRPYSLARVQKALAPDAAIVGWLESKTCASEPHARAWGYVIRGRGSVRWFPLDVRTDPAAQGAHLRALLLDPAERLDPAATELQAAARAVYATWFSPLEPALAGVADLVVLPSRSVLGLPFEVLVDTSGKSLLERFRLRYCSSATVATWLSERSRARRRGSSSPPPALLAADPVLTEIAAAPGGSMGAPPTATSVAGVPLLDARRWQDDARIVSCLRGGDWKVVKDLPPLRGARAEVERARGLFRDPTVLLGADASEQRFLDESKRIHRYRVIHMATHALVDDARPLESSLVLTQVGLPDASECARTGARLQDGRWTAGEVLREWKLDADLVVLSGCETALGRKVSGEGYVGFASAFLQAGARQLVLSLWEVDDASTALLMEQFYAHLLQDANGGATAPAGDRIAAALQRAKIYVRDWRRPAGGATAPDADRPYANPWYWSGFVLVGGSP